MTEREEVRPRLTDEQISDLIVRATSLVDQIQQRLSTPPEQPKGWRVSFAAPDPDIKNMENIKYYTALQSLYSFQLGLMASIGRADPEAFFTTSGVMRLRLEG